MMEGSIEFEEITKELEGFDEGIQDTDADLDILKAKLERIAEIAKGNSESNKSFWGEAIAKDLANIDPAAESAQEELRSLGEGFKMIANQDLVNATQKLDNSKKAMAEVGEEAGITEKQIEQFGKNAERAGSASVKLATDAAGVGEGMQRITHHVSSASEVITKFSFSLSSRSAFAICPGYQLIAIIFER